MMAERDFKTGAVRIGDLVGTSEGMAEIYVPGPARWYALRVPALREVHAEAWLKHRGVYAFHPVRAVQIRQFGKVRVYHRRYLPGYIFARFKGDPIVHRVCNCAFISGALTRQNGAWGVLEPDRLRKLHAMRLVDAKKEAARREAKARIRGHVTSLVGGEALFHSGPFKGQRCEIAELLTDGGVKVKMMLFGAEVLVSASAESFIPTS